MRIDVDTPHQPRNTSTIALCTYPATNGTVNKLFAWWQWAIASSNPCDRRYPLSLTAIPVRTTYQPHHLPYTSYHVAMRSPCGRIAWTTKPTCDFLASYHMRYSLTQWPYEVGLTQKVFANNRPYEKVKMRMGLDPTYRLALRSVSDLLNLVYRPVTGIASALTLVTYGQFTAWSAPRYSH